MCVMQTVDYTNEAKVEVKIYTKGHLFQYTIQHVNFRN